MAPPRQETLQDALHALVGLGVILGALYATGIIELPLGSETASGEIPATPNATNPSAARAEQATILATLQDFRAGLPLFDSEGGLVPKQESDRTKHTWRAKAGSVLGEGSWVIFEDRGSDGSLDQVTACVVWDFTNKATQVGALGFAYRLIGIASGNAPDSSEFTDWVVASAKGNKSTARSFGSTPVKFTPLTAGDAGLLIMLTIG